MYLHCGVYVIDTINTWRNLYYEQKDVTLVTQIKSFYRMFIFSERDGYEEYKNGQVWFRPRKGHLMREAMGSTRIPPRPRNMQRWGLLLQIQMALGVNRYQFAYAAQCDLSNICSLLIIKVGRSESAKTAPRGRNNIGCK